MNHIIDAHNDGIPKKRKQNDSFSEIVIHKFCFI
jgi:hypothetical protein